MRAIDINSTVDMIRFVCDAIIESKDLLTDVDSRTGDGDHGMGMAGGMAKAKAALEAGAPFSDIASIFKTTGMAMLNSMGGASGVIFSSMFLGGVKGMGDIKELNGAAFCAAMADALTAIK
ncbi:MAG: DAK2 domain-containing protein, partial [Christensenellales bacterium]